MEIDERELEERRRLIDHCDYFFRPAASFYSELEAAIALAAAGRTDEVVSFGGHPITAAELVEQYELEEFVERAKTPNAGGPEF